MSFFITGGASQTGTVVARLLKEAGKDVVFGSRSGRVAEGFESVRFDWEDPSTFEEPFASGRTFQGAYILSPMGLFDFSANMIAFIDLAAEKGVKRFVLMSGSMVDKAGEYGVAKVHRHLEAKGVDHFVLHPTLFMESMPAMFAKTITENQEIRTCTPNAKIPFVAVEDIARFAVDAFLAAQKIEITARRIIGPDLLTYDQVAQILSEVLDKKITHKAMSSEEAVEFYVGLPELGWPRPFAEIVVMLNQYVEAGTQEQLVGSPNTLVGSVGFKKWAEGVKGKFQV